MAASQSPSEAIATFADIFGNDEDLPTARLISASDQDPGFASAVVLAPEYGYIVEDAIAIPNEEGISSDIQMINGRAVMNQATRHGRMLAEQELEDIQRANVNVRAQNYFAEAAVNEANRLARHRTQLDNLNMNIAYTADTSAIKPIDNHTQHAAIQGTFGQDYEVSSYNVAEYSTKDYEVSSYQSVYER